MKLAIAIKSIRSPSPPEAGCGDDQIGGFEPVVDKIWIYVAGVDSFDELTLIDDPDGMTVASCGDRSTITVSLDSGYQFLTAKDFRFGVNSQVEDARARLDEIRAFGDNETGPATGHHFDAVSAHHAVLPDQGLGVLA